MSTDVLMQIVGSMGFPIAACAYFMVVMNKTISANTAATNKMISVISSVMDRIGASNE